MNEQHKMSISERRATFPLQERIRIYTPDTITRKKTKKLVIHGVNILNKSSLDSDTAMHRIKQRRETHNRVERRRRDNLVKKKYTQIATRNLIFYIEHFIESFGRTGAQDRT